MSTTEGPPPAPDATTGEGASTAKAPRQLVRRTITWILIVVFAILTPITLVSGWAVKTVTNTDRYVATLQPLVEDPVVTNYVADRATTLLFEQIDVQQQITQALPKAAAPLAAPLTNQLKQYTNTQMRKLTSSQWFKEFWLKENHFTQATALAILTGKPKPSINKARALAITLSPTIIKAIDQLDAKGVTIFDPIKKELQKNQKLTLDLYSSKQLKTAQYFFNLAVNLRTLLLFATPLIGIIAVVIAVDRRRTAMRALLGAILGILVLLGGLIWGRSQFIGAASGDGGQLFAQHVWDTMLRFLHTTINWTLAIFVVAVVVLWLVGDSTWALAIRRTVRGSGSQIKEKAGEAYHSETTAKAVATLRSALVRVDAYVGANTKALRWVGVIVAGFFLFISSTNAGLVWILVLLALYEGAVSIPTLRARRAALGTGAPEEEQASLTSAPTGDEEA